MSERADSGSSTAVGDTDRSGGPAVSRSERQYITCRELLDFLHLYLENELPEDRHREFERHLGVCEPCRRYIREYQAAIRLGTAAFAGGDDPLPPDTPEDLVQAILKVRRGSSGR
jgi:anti-sigma factor RsiW